MSNNNNNNNNSNNNYNNEKTTEKTLTPEIKNQIDEIINKNNAVLFMKGTPAYPVCKFSVRMVCLLLQAKLPFTHVNILEEPNLRSALKIYSDWPTFPQLYIKGEFIGGLDVVREGLETHEFEWGKEFKNHSNSNSVHSFFSPRLYIRRLDHHVDVITSFNPQNRSVSDFYRFLSSQYESQNNFLISSIKPKQILVGEDAVAQPMMSVMDPESPRQSTGFFVMTEIPKNRPLYCRPMFWIFMVVAAAVVVSDRVRV